MPILDCEHHHKTPRDIRIEKPLRDTVRLRAAYYDHECDQVSKVRLSVSRSDVVPLHKISRMFSWLTVADTYRKYPQFQQDEIFGLLDAFRRLDVDDKGYIDEATVIKATQQSERQPYDVVRQALKEVGLDSSRRVELDDYVDVGLLCCGVTFCVP